MTSSKSTSPFPCARRTIEHARGRVHIEDRSGGGRLLRVEIPDGEASWARMECSTTYPDELIQMILEVKGPTSLCDEIARDEDPSYVRFRLEKSILAYAAPEAFEGALLLDFGCGSGASTMILARLFPGLRIVGIEMMADLLSIARARARHYGLDHVTFLQSPSETELPNSSEGFDFIMLNAVYEHLLPEERSSIMPRLWSALKDGGTLFLNETPNRAYHREVHTTSLPLINYLPDRLAHDLVRRYSYRFNDASWRTLLREGIRGGTQGEIERILRRAGAPRPVVLEPSRLGLRDRVDLRFSLYNDGKFLTAKQRLRRAGLRFLKLLTGITYGPELMLAIRKG